MKYSSFIKKLKKRLGVEHLEIESDNIHSSRRKEWLVYEDTIASWYVEPRDWNDSDSEPEVSSFHTKAVGQESDPYTDYYPGTYWSNGTQLIDRLKSPDPKFAVGSLVRGKPNKRAIRNGYAHKVGLVLDSKDRYIQVHFTGDSAELLNNPPGNFTRKRLYPERDFELIRKGDLCAQEI